MKTKKLACLILSALTTFSLYACSDSSQQNATDEAMLSENAAVTTTAITKSEATTAPEVKKPEFEAPEVITAQEYKKNAVDIMEDGGLDFVHSISYPKINSEAPGAIALNQKIADIPSNIITELKENKEESALYSISYSTSTSMGLIFIKVDYGNGRQYSEWYNYTELYYYDAEKDSEISPAEYASYFDIELSDLIPRALWSSKVQSLGTPNDIYSESPYGKTADTVEINKLYYKGCTEIISDLTYEKIEFKIKGIEAAEAGYTVYAEYSPTYGSGSFSLLLDDSLLPTDPEYLINIQPTDVSSTAEIKFDDGRLTYATAPAEIVEIVITAGEIKVFSEDGKTVSKLLLNGEEIPASGEGIQYNQYVLYNFYFDYLAPNELKTITIE